MSYNPIGYLEDRALLESNPSASVAGRWKGGADGSALLYRASPEPRKASNSRGSGAEPLKREVLS